jgi:hypothetical protein
VDADGSVYIADDGNDVIRVLVSNWRRPRPRP